MEEVLKEACTAIDAEFSPERDPLRLQWNRLADYTALVVAREARVTPQESKDVWVNPQHERAIAEYVEGGGSLVVLHAGLASYDPEGAYVGITRGYFLMHPAEHPRFAVSPRPEAKEAGFEIDTFEIEDEMYFVKVDSGRTHRLFESSCADFGLSCAAWAHTAGKGRVFCFTPGHTEQVLHHPSYRAIVQRGMKWATDRG